MEKTVLISMPLEELQTVIIDCVNACIKMHSNKIGYQAESSLPTLLNFEQAVQLLNTNGYPISESKLYKLTSSNEVPVKHFGRKLIFSRKALLAWVEAQTVDKSDTSDTSLVLARSARRKR